MKRLIFDAPPGGHPPLKDVLGGIAFQQGEPSDPATFSVTRVGQDRLAVEWEDGGAATQATLDALAQGVSDQYGTQHRRTQS